MMMRYGLTMGIAALAAWLLIVSAGAQKVAPGAVLDDITPRYVEIPRDQLRVEPRYPLNQFSPRVVCLPPTSIWVVTGAIPRQVVRLVWATLIQVISRPTNGQMMLSWRAF